MSENGSVYSIAITLLILNIVTPVFVFALTDLSIDQNYQEGIAYLNEDDLIASGIYLRTDERHLLTYAGAPDYVEFVNTTQVFRVRWADLGGVLTDHEFEIYTKLYGELNDWWISAELRKVIINREIYQAGLTPRYIRNSTIGSNWNNEYNWTRASIPSLGTELFFTCEKYNNNITQALDAGELNVTAGTTIDYEEFTPRNFISWYFGQLTGANYYDMPVYISWVFRIQAVLLIFSGAIIARDLIGFT